MNERMKKLEADVRRLQEQVEALTEILVVEDEPEDEPESTLEAGHQAFMSRIRAREGKR